MLSKSNDVAGVVENEKNAVENESLAERKNKRVGCSGNLDCDPYDRRSDGPELIDLAYRFNIRAPGFPLPRLQAQLAKLRGRRIPKDPKTPTERSLKAKHQRADDALETLCLRLEIRARREPALAHDLARLGVWADLDWIAKKQSGRNPEPTHDLVAILSVPNTTDQYAVTEITL